MSPISFATQYLTLNILLALGFAGAALLFKLNQKWALIKSSDELRFNYFLISVVIFFAFVQTALPHEEFFKPPAKIWSATTSATFDHEFKKPGDDGYLSIEMFRIKPLVKTNTLASSFCFTMMLVLFFGLFRFLKDINALVKLGRHSFLVRRHRRVRILASDFIDVPFSYRLGRSAIVVVPNAMLGHREDLNFAIFHELQHHRQLDTFWVYVLWLLKMICFLNPAIYLWNQVISEVQEFACDETLVDRKKVSSSAYASCLVRVALTAINSKRGFVCATGLTFRADRHSLKRRISTMMVSKPKTLQKSITAAFAAAVVAALAGAAMASQSLVKDRRVDLNEAQQMLAHVPSNSGFHVVINDLVLKELNHYVGTPDGRDFMKKSLARMQKYEAMVKQNLTSYAVPENLIVIPIVESGYQNLAQPAHQHGAGLWMFIASTARNYGLRVDAQFDERLDEAVLTDAAMRYLTANHARFRSWELSVFAYNIGETKVQEAIDATGSHDAFDLIRAGYEGDPGYLAKVMAAILIKDNPSVLR